jgi:hypothetical protein
MESSKEDTIEFYDSRYPHTPDGQFITRYYVSTLSLKDYGRPQGSGLDLYGSEPDWKIDGRVFAMVRDWAARLNCNLQGVGLPLEHPHCRNRGGSRMTPCDCCGRRVDERSLATVGEYMVCQSCASYYSSEQEIREHIEQTKESEEEVA